jgi:hypothetical protein
MAQVNRPRGEDTGMQKPKKLSEMPPFKMPHFGSPEWYEEASKVAPCGSREWDDQIKMLSEKMPSVDSREWRDELEMVRKVVEAIGRDELIRRAVEGGPPGSLCGLIQALQITSPEAVDLITAFAMLRYRSAEAADIEAWRRRAAAFLLRYIGDAATGDASTDRTLANYRLSNAPGADAT